MNKVNLFDLDHTLFTTNITYAFLKKLVSCRIISPRITLYYPLYQLYKWGKVSSTTLWETIFNRFLRGLPLSLCQRIGNEVVEQLFSSHLNTPIIKALKDSVRSNEHVCVASCSFDFLVNIVVKNLKLDSYVGTKCLLDDSGCLLNLGSICNGYKKKKWVLDIISSSQPGSIELTIYTDSIDDLPLLEISDVPVCVSPDRPLRKMANLNNWRIID